MVNEFERTQLAARGATRAAGVVTPIACLPDHFALVTEEAPGVPLDRLLKRLWLARTPATLARIRTTLGRLGQWVEAFQAAVPTKTTVARDRREYLDVRLRRLVAAGGRAFDEVDRAAILSRFDRLAGAVPAAELELTAIHGDFCPSNVLVREDGVTVLDLAMTADGCRYHDLAHLYMHIGLLGRHLRLGQGVTGRLQAALLAGFDPALTAEQPLFRLMVMQHVACHLVEATERVERFPTRLREPLLRRHVRRGLAIAGITSARPFAHV